MIAPIILFVYNRPYHSKQTLHALSENTLANESILYIYADGPKAEASVEDAEKIQQTRQVIRENQWCKEVHIIESVINKGLADSIVDGVTEIVNKHGKVIVLEDDIVTSKGFLKYMNDALHMYENEEKVMHISGYMFPVKQKLPETFFYNTASCWGWGTWKRAWRYYNSNAEKLISSINQKNLIDKFNVESSYDFYSHLKANAEGTMKTWAVKWYASFFIKGGFALHPGESLVENIGLDGSGVNSGISNRFAWKELAENINVRSIKIIELEQARKAMIDFNLSFQQKHVKNKTIFKSISAIVPLHIKKSIYSFLYPKGKPKVKILSTEETEKLRLQSLPRYQPTTTHLLNKPLSITDSASFLYLYKEIFEYEIYKFIADNSQPYILDCGANIGLSILYFKKIYPKAEIIGFEPDANIFKILTNNVKSFGLEKVTLVEKGLWNKETTLNFYAEGSDGGRIVEAINNGESIEIQTIRLCEFLNKPVDFLKIDIEGAETAVLEDCKDLLHNVKNLFVEYHSYLGAEQTLDKILRILKDVGFRYSIQQHGVVSMNPFTTINSQDNMDILLNISAYRQDR